jgi:hypothetical protein
MEDNYSALMQSLVGQRTIALMLPAAPHTHVLELLGDVFEPRHIDRSNVATLTGVEEHKTSYVLSLDSRDGGQGKQVEWGTPWMMDFIFESFMSASGQ